MKIGILVHSKTGNTLFVAQRLQETLTSAGHSASILRITAVNDEEADFSKVILEEKPDAAVYDALIFGAPVRGFSLSAVMQSFLTGIAPLNGKKTACFMTQSLPYPWMGGTRALRQCCKLCRGKGADIYATGIINWSNAEKREKLIQALNEKCCNATQLCRTDESA